MTNLLLSSELLLIPQSSLDQVIICTRLDWIVLFFCIRRHSIESIALPFIFNLISVSVAYNLVLDYAKVLDSLSFISSFKKCTTIFCVCVFACVSFVSQGSADSNYSQPSSDLSLDDEREALRRETERLALAQLDKARVSIGHHFSLFISVVILMHKPQRVLFSWTPGSKNIKRKKKKKNNLFLFPCAIFGGQR